MSITSILFKKEIPLSGDASHLFVDLNLDQIINAIVPSEKEEEYNLKAFFYTPLNNKANILYRQEVMHDLENEQLFQYIQAFAKNMHAVRQQLPREGKHYYKYQKERLLLDAAENYCNTVSHLTNDLQHAAIQSAGFKAFCSYLNRYVQSPAFTTLQHEAKQLLNELSAACYCVLVKDLRVQVRRCSGETDYTEEVQQVFEKFRQEPAKDYTVEYRFTPEMNHVEAAILEGVASLYPELFTRLEDFYATHAKFADEAITAFDREVQFYVLYLTYIAKLKAAGLPFCCPIIIENDKHIYSYEGFDLALAHKLNEENKAVVCNDFYLQHTERIIIITGPNQGGKTTFARMFGQLHYLAALGCPVPGTKAKLFLFDQLFTHFEKEENILQLRSKLEDDLIRIHDILNRATSHSIIIMNEILSSTTLQDAVFISKKIMQKIVEKDILCVWVTFMDELLGESDTTVSMVSTVMPQNPAQRTFKIERMPADGLAYALSIAEKYKVTYQHLQQRLPQ